MPGLPRRGILAAAAWLPSAARAQALLGTEALVAAQGALPAFAFTSAEGGARTLADFAGRPVLLNLWATWCVPCVAEMPALDRLAAALPGLAVLPLSSDRGGAAKVAQFYAQNAITHLPTLLDPRGDAARALGARGIPTSIVVGRDGQGLARLEGAAEWDSSEMIAWLRSHAQA